MTAATRVAAWAKDATDLAIDPHLATLERLAGGNSNETYLLSDGERFWIVRRPPAHELDASAHSMSREWTVLRALAGTEVPTAGVLGYCDDRSILGTDFLLMRYVPDSVSLQDTLPPTYSESPETLQTLGISLAEVLATIQSVDWRAVGLEGFGRPDGFLARQIPRWEGQYRRNQVRDIAAFERVTAWLAAQQPPEQPAALMHGDFHLDNCLFAVDRPELLAVVDWEMATIGDPLVDVGLCLALWGPRPNDHPAMPRIQAISRTAGAPTRDELAVAYEELSGRDISHLRWYQAFALWKLGVVIEPAWGQHLRGELRTDYTAALEHDVPALFEEAAVLAGIDL